MLFVTSDLDTLRHLLCYDKYGHILSFRFKNQGKLIILGNGFNIMLVHKKVNEFQDFVYCIDEKVYTSTTPPEKHSGTFLSIINVEGTVEENISDGLNTYM